MLLMQLVVRGKLELLCTQKHSKCYRNFRMEAFIISLIKGVGQE